MATNQGDSSHKETVNSSSQVYNPANGHYVKRDTESGTFLSVKTDGTPFKGARTEKVVAKANPYLKKSIAIKIEKAVIAVLNSKKAKK